MKISILEAKIIEAAHKGEAAFLDLIGNSILQEVGGELNSEALSSLNFKQVTLIGYTILRREVLEGGFIQLIYNGYGALFFRNPFAKAIRYFGITDLSKDMYDIRRIYDLKRTEIEKECIGDEDFMALYEQYPEFDEYDDRFVENEEIYTSLMAHYVDEHLNDFIEVIKA